MFFTGDYMFTLKDMTKVKAVPICDVPMGSTFKIKGCEDVLYMKVNPSSLGDALVKLGEGRLAVRLSDGLVFIAKPDTYCVEVIATVSIDSLKV